eukprot:jgi/Ulvmu1/7952/UM004_0185.1
MARGVAPTGKRSPLVRRHILATSLIMCMHSINITLPWTIGVFMIRNFMGIGHDEMALGGTHLNNDSTWSAAAPVGWSSAAVAPAPELWVLASSQPGQGGGDFQTPRIGNLTAVSSEEKVHLEAQVGYQAGILSSAFSIAQVLTALAWGQVANRAGTNVLMQLSQASAVLANIAIAFAPTFWWAVVARFLGGLVNSITGANKTNIAQSFHLEHQPYVFGITMSCWAVGSIASPVIGGVLAEPCKTWPDLPSSVHCAPDALLARFPFMLPCLVTAVLCAMSMVVCAFALGRNEDVLAAWPRESSAEDQPLFSEEAKSSSDGDLDIHALGLEEAFDSSGDWEKEALLTAARNPLHAQQPFSHKERSRRIASALGGHGLQHIGRGSIELPEMRHIEVQTSPRTHAAASSMAPVQCASAHPAEAKGSTLHRSDSASSIVSFGAPQQPWWKDRQIQLRLVGYATLAIMFSILAESIPIYAAMPLKHHGLGWSSMQLAAPMSIGGLSLMVSATLLYPHVNKALGCKRTCIAGLLCMIPVTLAYPLISFVAPRAHVAMVLMASFGAVHNVAVNFTFASGNVLVNEAASKPELKAQIGSVNGAGHMLSSAVRAVGPALAGTLWSIITATDITGGVFVPFAICFALILANIKLYSVV